MSSVPGVYTEKQIVNFVSLNQKQPPTAGRTPIVVALCVAILLAVGATLLILGAKKFVPELLVSSQYAQEQIIAGWVLAGVAVLGLALAGALALRKRIINRLSDQAWGGIYEQVQNKLASANWLIVQRADGRNDLIRKNTLHFGVSSNDRNQMPQSQAFVIEKFE